MNTLEHTYPLVQSLAAVGILGALICITSAIADNTAAVKANTAQNAKETFREQYTVVAQSPDLADILLRASHAPEEVPTAQRFRFYAHLFSMVRAWEHAYLQRMDGYLDDRHWQGFEPADDRFARCKRRTWFLGRSQTLVWR